MHGENMKLTSKKIYLNEELQVLTWCIVSTELLQQIHLVGNPELFESTYSQLVAGWVWNYFKIAKESPGREVQKIYLRERKNIKDEEDLELIGEFLTNLSKTWEKTSVFNLPFATSQSIEYFKKRSLQRLSEKLEVALESGDVRYAESLVGGFKRVERPSGEAVQILRDSTKVIEAFTLTDEIMFSFPGDLGKTVGPIVRGDFVAVLGAMGRGKSWWLLYFAVQASIMGFKSIFYSLEMTEPQVVRRAWQMIQGVGRYENTVNYPHFVEGEEEGKWEIEHEEKKINSIDVNSVEGIMKKMRLSLRGADLRIETMPSMTASLADIENSLTNLEVYENFVPDIIVIDYADIIVPERYNRENRQEIDLIWKTLRGWAQKRNCSVITGSQTNREALDRDAKGKNIAEDIRKLGHVSKMIALNQTEKEYEANIMRVSSLKERDKRRWISQACVLQCLDIGRPYLDSRMVGDVEYER